MRRSVNVAKDTGQGLAGVAARLAQWNGRDTNANQRERMTMGETGGGSERTLLERREIEAGIAGPLIRAFQKELGTERTLEIVRGVIADLAREGGADLARRVGEASLSAFASCLDLWRAGGALELDILEQSPERLEFNVTRCRYAEMYRALGLADLGSSLSCQRDFALVEGFNPEIALTRTQTLMEGAPFCDFRFRAGSSRSAEPADGDDREAIREADFSPRRGGSQ